MSSIFIFRRDFRLNDNTGLLKAFKESTHVHPIFIFNPLQIDDKNNSFKSNNSVQFFIESMTELKESIQLEYYYGDDIDVLRATKQLLESWGCNVKTARNKDEVMNLIKEDPYKNPDIILADNRLPGDASGIDITYLIQEKLQTSIPCVIMTGDVERSHVQGIIDQGFPVLLKPIQPAKFRAMLSHLIQA